MQEIRILTLHPTLPHVKSAITLFFDNLLPVLQTKANVHMIWLVYKPEKLTMSQHNDPNTTIIDIHDYDNALELLRQTKPDIIFADPIPQLIEYALSSAGKFLNIPVIGGFYTYVHKTSRSKLVRSHLTRFFQNSIPTDTGETQKQFMKRGRFFIYKYLFLLRTQIAVKLNPLQIFESFFMLLQSYFLETGYPMYPKLANTLHWVDREGMADQLVNAGFNRTSIVVTGNPMYDSIFKKLKKIQPTITTDNKIRVLLITTSFYEHGNWTRAQRDNIIKEIVTEVCKYKNEISLLIKIHPSSEILSEYKEIINPIDTSIPIHQKGDALEFLENADIVISFASDSAITYALLAKKPIILCNFYDLKGDLFLERGGLALECKKISELIPAIQNIVRFNPATDDNVESFVKEFLYKSDGLASERLCNAMLKLLNKNNT